MKAAVYSEYGPPDVLRVQDVARPEPRADEILVRIRAAEVTKGDCELRSFDFAVHWFAVPLRIAWGIRRPRRTILGGYFAGVVEAVGSDVSQFHVGDEVFGAAGMRMGAHAEYVALPERSTIAKKPANVGFEEAAAVPLGGLNALHFVRLLNVRNGDRVLVNGAGGSIGAYAVQIAVAQGARVTVVDAAHKKDLLLELGADTFIDYEREDFVDAGRVYDVVFDMVAGSDYSRCLRALQPEGRYATGNPTLAKMLRATATTRLSRRTAHFSFAGETLEELNTLRAMIEAGTIRPIVDRVYPLEQIAEAHRRVESEERLGIVVVSLQEEPGRVVP